MYRHARRAHRLAPGLTEERVARLEELGAAYWGVQGNLTGWTIAFTHRLIEFDGVRYDGYCWPGKRLIWVNPFYRQDCAENSVIFHELGHAWGFGHDDARM
jgi:hypothetical protein